MSEKTQHVPSPPILKRETSSPKTTARRIRTLSTLTERLKRKERGIHIVYQGEDTELFWTTPDELRRAPLPFLDEIKDPKITIFIKYLKERGYVIIPPVATFNPESILGSSSKNTTKKKKKKKKGRVTHTRRY